MKWYFALNENSLARPDHDWEGMVRVAVRSALDNTSLDPHFIYDGEENELIAELRGWGVKVIRHRLSFYDRLAEVAPDAGYMTIAGGAFLRVDIPLIEQEDDYVLYTDCDVIFLKHPAVDHLRPVYFDIAPQSSKTDYLDDMNSGVMVMNLVALRAVNPWFIESIIEDLRVTGGGFDQESYRRFFHGRWGELDLRLNWKPYWGVDDEAAIIHWHGPKPGWTRQNLAGRAPPADHPWTVLYQMSPRGYGFYARIWTEIWARTPRQILAHLDVISATGGGGWAIRRGAARGPLRLTPWIDGKPQAEVVCDQPRPDVAAAHGPLEAGFNFAIAAAGEGAPPRRLFFTDEHFNRVTFTHKGQQIDGFEFA